MPLKKVSSKKMSVKKVSPKKVTMSKKKVAAAALISLLGLGAASFAAHKHYTSKPKPKSTVSTLKSRYDEIYKKLRNKMIPGY